MAAPRKKNHKEPVNLTFSTGFKNEAISYAGEHGKSLSQLVEELLKHEIESKSDAPTLKLSKPDVAKLSPEGAALQQLPKRKRGPSAA